jgi:hypothetical protein
MKRVVWVLVMGIIVTVALQYNPSAPAGKQPAGSPEDLRAHIEALRAQVKHLEQLVPDQAAVKTHVGYHWSNLWAALGQENWALADFYLSETRSNLAWAVRVKPERKSSAGEKVDLKAIFEALDNSQLKEMKAAIGKKDKTRCVKLYDDALAGCYACHKASEKPYLRPQRPTAAEVRIINFDPNVKDPQ